MINNGSSYMGKSRPNGDGYLNYQIPLAASPGPASQLKASRAETSSSEQTWQGPVVQV